MNYCIIHRRFILLHELQRKHTHRKNRHKKLYSDDQKFARYPITQDLQLSNTVLLLLLHRNKVTLLLQLLHATHT